MAAVGVHVEPQVSSVLKIASTIRAYSATATVATVVFGLSAFTTATIFGGLFLGGLGAAACVLTGASLAAYGPGTISFLLVAGKLYLAASAITALFFYIIHTPLAALEIYYEMGARDLILHEAEERGVNITAEINWEALFVLRSLPIHYISIEEFIYRPLRIFEFVEQVRGREEHLYFRHDLTEVYPIGEEGIDLIPQEGGTNRPQDGQLTNIVRDLSRDNQRYRQINACLRALHGEWS